MVIMAKPSKEVRKVIADAVNAVKNNADGIRLVAFQTAKGQMARRIFTQGNATGGQIGNYAASTKRFRERAGRQTSKVDLSLTQTLEKSFGVGTSEGRSVIGISETQEPKVSAKGGTLRIKGLSGFSTVENAIQQEKNFNKEIFAPSEQELKRAETTIAKEVNRVVKKAIG